MIDGEALGFDAMSRRWIVRLSDDLYVNMCRTAEHLDGTRLGEVIDFRVMHRLFAALAGMTKSELDELILRGIERGEHGTSTEDTATAG